MTTFRILKMLAAACLLAASYNAGAENNSIQLTQQQIENLGIKLGHPVPASHIPVFTAPAKVVVPPAHEFIVSTSLSGLITKMNAAIGDKVSKGEVIGLINSPELLTLQGDYLKAAGALKLASATYDRDKKLRKEGVVSGRSEQEAYSIFNAAQIEASEAKQLLRIAGMTAEDVQLLDRNGRLSSQLSIRSPIDGRVLERMTVSGTRVDTLTPLYRIANLNVLWLEINIPQEHLTDIAVGDRVVADNIPAEAEIKVLGESVHTENQTVLARAVVTSGLNSLKVGQKLTVQHFQATPAQTYQLPDSAITSHQGKTYVFVRDSSGFSVKAVTVLGKQAGGSVVTGDLSGNEELAVNNTVVLKANWLGIGSGE